MYTLHFSLSVGFVLFLYLFKHFVFFVGLFKPLVPKTLVHNGGQKPECLGSNIFRKHELDAPLITHLANTKFIRKMLHM